MEDYEHDFDELGNAIRQAAAYSDTASQKGLIEYIDLIGVMFNKVENSCLKLFSSLEE